MAVIVVFIIFVEKIDCRFFKHETCSQNLLREGEVSFNLGLDTAL